MSEVVSLKPNSFGYHFVPDTPFNKENCPESVNSFVFGCPSYMAVLPTVLANGAYILKAKATPGGRGTAPGFVVLAFRDTKVHDPFVTWWLNGQDMGCSSGHYYSSLDKAIKDYEERCRTLCR